MSSGQHILLVDDEPNVGDVLGIYLRRENFRVAITRDGQAALDVIAQTPPDLIGLDLMLPHIDGLAIMRQLRGATGHPGLLPEVPIIILTAKGEESDRIIGLRAISVTAQRLKLDCPADVADRPPYEQLCEIFHVSLLAIQGMSA